MNWGTRFPSCGELSYSRSGKVDTDERRAVMMDLESRRIAEPAALVAAWLIMGLDLGQAQQMASETMAARGKLDVSEWDTLVKKSVQERDQLHTEISQLQRKRNVLARIVEPASLAQELAGQSCKPGMRAAVYEAKIRELFKYTEEPASPVPEEHAPEEPAP